MQNLGIFGFDIASCAVVGEQDRGHNLPKYNRIRGHYR